VGNRDARPEPEDVSLSVGGRLSSAPAPELITSAFAHELAEEAVLFDGMSYADLAHTVVMIEAGVVPEQPGRELLAALEHLRRRPADFAPDPARGDLYTNREAYLARRTDAARWLGVGRTRREAATVAYHLVVRSELLAVGKELVKAATALIERAQEHAEAIMADYTYLQAAQPTTFGHYLIAFVYPILRDLDRAKNLFRRVNLSPAGCGGINGSRLPQDRARLAALLGFDGCVVHARDAMWQADVPIETMAVATAATINFARFAEDLQIFATSEFGLIEIPDRYARASVLMPQKKNPYALAYVRGVANEMVGTQAAVVALNRTATGQMDNRIFVYGKVPHALKQVANVASLIAGVLREMRFDRARGKAATADGFVMAADLAETITTHTGVDFRSAHQIVARLVRQFVACGRSLSTLTGPDLDAVAAEMTGQPLKIPVNVLEQALNPAKAVAARENLGGAGPGAIAAMCDECRGSLAEYAQWWRSAEERIAAAHQELMCRVVKLGIEIDGAPHN
jgi:argininosuccinate lyase